MSATTSRKTVIVIGNGMVGQRFLEALIERGGARRFEVIVCGEEPRAAYDRVHLSEFFAGKTAEDLSMAAPEFYADNGIRLLSGERVDAIDRERRQVCTASGAEFGYDFLVIATGSYPFVPPIPGHDREGCFVYRTIEDLEAIAAAAAGSRIGAVVGGGLLGLEAANALHELGLETHVVEFAPRLMATQIDAAGGAMLQRKIELLGVSVHHSTSTQAIVAGGERSLRMEFAGGNALDTDLIVFSAGIRPRDELARASGLKTGARGGIVIDDHCCTSDPAIFAIGECALWREQLFGLVGPGNQMAEVVAAQLTGDVPVFAGADMSTQLKLLGVDVASIGDAHARTPGAHCYAFSDERREIYRKIVVGADGKRLLGAVLVGDNSDYGMLLQLTLNGIELPADPAALIVPRVDGAPALGADRLPDAAQICSCNNVSKRTLLDAIDDGAVSLAELKTRTRAGTTCGGCTALTGQILNLELERRGIAVSRDLCEHFPYSRQDLYLLVRAERITSFDTLIARHGRGRGCDICKPAVASILASCWNAYVLNDAYTPLQDTNDRFLANMQKDGTYSIVPRVPGGEITPARLIAIGDVAQRFGLYTKITGAQRIDLFGARVEQLPLIWRALIDAGFESGHAYAKALRTVKSCVGSSWCRHGVQDSVRMAIALEHRYKGLRAPHKIKMAVSGCARECAEAQSKDVGVIATERGWNLYVCGNGGMRPRHADLFATDLDDPSLMRTIDRFLMFYIRTADRLQRTANWLESLAGGLDYLREVVIDDRLGVAAELEAEMAAVAGSYQCEWRRTLDDPEQLKYFRHFVNSDQVDDNIVFVQERQQIRPATTNEKLRRAG